MTNREQPADPRPGRWCEACDTYCESTDCMAEDFCAQVKRGEGSSATIESCKEKARLFNDARRRRLASRVVAWRVPDTTRPGHWLLAEDRELLAFFAEPEPLYAILATQGAPKAEAPADFERDLADRNLHLFLSAQGQLNSVVTVWQVLKHWRPTAEEEFQMEHAQAALAHAQRPAPDPKPPSNAQVGAEAPAADLGQPYYGCCPSDCGRECEAPALCGEANVCFRDGTDEPLRESAQRPAGPATPVSVRERIEALPKVETQVAPNPKAPKLLWVPLAGVLRILDEGKS